MSSRESSPVSENSGNIQEQLKSLHDNVDHLEAVASLPAKQRTTSVKSIASDIASDAYNIGIPIDDLERLVDILTKPNHLDQSTITTLIKNLYPHQPVPSGVVTKIVCCLGPTSLKPSPATQALLLQWLLLVYDFLEDPHILTKFYSVLFNMLDMISLRRPLCHVLSLITRRQHVKPFRVQALMELVRTAADDEKALLGLLRVFKNYFSNIIIGDLGRSKLFFKHPDPEWTARLKRLQDMNLERARFRDSRDAFQIVGRDGLKRRKVAGVIPDIQTSRMRSTYSSLEELRNVDGLVDRLERIELPNQIISVMENRMARKYMAFVRPKDAEARLEDWLRAFLRDEVETISLPDATDSEALRYVLEAVSDYVQCTKKMPDAISQFLRTFIQTWNGKDYRSEILSILKFLPRDSHNDLRGLFLDRLDSILLNYTASAATDLLDFYSDLIRQWGISLRADTTTSFTTGGFKPLISLVSHTELLLLSLMEVNSTSRTNTTNTGKPITMSVLEFYSSLADLYSHASTNANIRLAVPLAPAIYSLALSSNLAQISQLSNVLAIYKNSFETSLTSQSLQSPDRTARGFYGTETVGLFNGYIMDMCNLVWRNRALNSDDQNAHGCLISDTTKNALVDYINDSNEIVKHRRGHSEGPAFNYSLGQMFSLSHHVALASHSAACFATFEERNYPSGVHQDTQMLRAPVKQKTLTSLEQEGGMKMTWQGYRVRMLDWFDALGSDGIGNLMRRTMKVLRNEG